VSEGVSTDPAALFRNRRCPGASDRPPRSGLDLRRLVGSSDGLRI